MHSGAPDPTPDELRAEVRELCAQWRRDGRYIPRSDSWLRSPDRAFSKELAARGLLGMTWPTPYGRGLGQLHRLAVTEELLRAGAPVALHWIADRQIGPAILRHGSEELKTELLPAIATAEAQPPPPPCIIRVSDPDALTLAELRALSTADTVFHTPRASAAILDRARRDAVRVVAAALPADLPPGRSVFVGS